MKTNDRFETLDRVIVIEDDVRVREMLHESIHDMGLNCTAVGSSEAAMKALGQEPFDVAILDLNLPGMGGMELLERMRQQWPELQVIILTGFGSLDDARKAIRQDVVDFLTKPCRLGELELALDRARRRRGKKMPAVPEPEAEKFEDLPELVNAPENASLDEVERQHILAALKRHNGNRNAAAAELKISVRTLYYRLQRYQQEGQVP